MKFSTVRMICFSVFMLGATTSRPATAWGAPSLGKVEFQCSNYNTGEDSVTFTAPITRAIGGCDPIRNRLFHAGATVVAPSGLSYSVDLWFDRNPSRRGMSGVVALGVYKATEEQARISYMSSVDCNSVFVADKKWFSATSISATREGVTYPESFSCGIRIIPESI